MISIIRKWFKGSAKSPSKDWQRLGRHELQVDLDAMSLNGVMLGTSLLEAKALGRPDLVEKITEEHYQFFYFQSGFIADFEDDALTYISISIGPDELAPKSKKMLPAEPTVVAQSLRTQIFSPETSESEIRSWLGEPEDSDVDHEETILFYDRNNTEVEFEFSKGGKLKWFNFYRNQ
jgi:hypothetical protein